MAEFEPPSFSLGLDLDDTPPPSPPASPIPDPLLQVSDSDPETRPDPPSRTLKRLRRGPPSSSVHRETEPQPSYFGDDDIEEFSSPEKPVQVCSSSVQNRSVCSSSKVSLKSLGVLTRHSFANSRENKRKHASSPLRRFQLLDSEDDDSYDDHMFDEDVGGVNKVGPSLSVGSLGKQSAAFTTLEQDGKMQFDVNKNLDLWKDFSPVKNLSVPTPAFNEMYEEYFSSAKNAEVPRSGIGISENQNEMYHGVDSGLLQDEQIWEAAGPLPPAHRYFFNEDPRIQHLVRSRLCNFSPLGVNGVNQQQNVSHIDYMGQFDNRGAAKMPGVQKGRNNGSTSKRSKSRNLNVQETFNASEGWVDPKIISPPGNGTSSRKKATKRNSTKSSVSKRESEQRILNSSNVSGSWVEPKSGTMPKDAGRRRVQASGQSAGRSTGHWFTGPDGRKNPNLYLHIVGLCQQNGQEMTGRSAYMHYRKESGSGFKKSKKKTSTKKANAKKRN